MATDNRTLGAPVGIADPDGPTARSLAGGRSHAHPGATHEASGIDAFSKAHLEPHETAKTQAWINEVLPSARAVHEKWGIPTSVVIAQGALESEWGTKHPGNEYFGVKSHGSTGPTTSIATHEVGAGGRHAERDSFRAYASLAEAADDYGRFMTTQPRYRHAFEHTDDPHRFVQEVAKAKWGTDPDYAEKVNGVIDRHRLTRHDAPEQTASSSAPNAKALWAAVAQRGRDAMRASLGEQKVRLGATNVISPQATAPPQTQAAMPTLRLRR